MRRILASIVILAQFSVCAFADEQNRVFALNNFSKGLNTQESPYLIQDNHATQADNVRFNGSYGGVSKRPIMLSYGDAGSTAITSMHRYYKSDGTAKLIITTSTLMRVGDDSAGTFQTIKGSLSDGKKWKWVTYKDIAIGMNGTDNAQKYDGKTQITANTDGSRTSEELTAELGAPFAELNTGSNLDASSWYQYKVAFYDGSTYSYSQARSNPIQTGSSVQDITLTDIPLGPTGTTSRIIYRTEGNASKANVLADTSYYRVGTISDNTTTTYNDTVTDTTLLTDTAPTWATASAGNAVTPPTGKYATIHEEKLFIAGNSTNPSDVYWSDTYNPDYFELEDFLQVRADDGDEITFIEELLGTLTVSKTRSIQKILTNGAEEDWVITPRFTKIGCISPYSAFVTPIGIVYLGHGGIYQFNGQTVKLMSDAVTPEIRDILVTNLDDVVGYYFKNEYHMAYTSSASGETNNNRVLVYDFIRDAYALDIKDVLSFEAFDSGDDYGVLYLGASDTSGTVYADEGVPYNLSKKLKSEFNDASATFDDARVYGTELDPTMELAWDTDIDNTAGTINAQSGIIDRPDTDGTWTSAVYQINASELNELSWNERLNGNGDVTWQIRTGDVTPVDGTWSAWSSAVTAPTGSDVSGVTAGDYIQLRANLSTSNINVTPELFVDEGFLFKLSFSRSGTSAESSGILSVWKSGWLPMGVGAAQKFLKRIKVFYTGTAGTITLRYENSEGNINQTFNVDMSIDPDSDSTDYYTGNTDTKIYTFYPQYNQSAQGSPIGQFWTLSIEESAGTTEWRVEKIEVVFNVEPLSDV